MTCTTNSISVVTRITNMFITEDTSIQASQTVIPDWPHLSDIQVEIYLYNQRYPYTSY